MKRDQTLIKRFYFYNNKDAMSILLNIKNVLTDKKKRFHGKKNKKINSDLCATD